MLVQSPGFISYFGSVDAPNPTSFTVCVDIIRFTFGSLQTEAPLGHHAMMTGPDSSSWDSEGNLLVPLHGIRIALGLSFLAACVFCVFTYLGDKQWHDRNPGDSGEFVTPPWIWGLRIALVLVPFVVSALLLSTRGEHSKAAGAGVAFALFSSGLLLGIAGFLNLFLAISPDPYPLPDFVAILTFLASSLWIVVSAIRIGKVSLGLFFLALVITAVCLIWGNHVLDDKVYKLGRQHEQQKSQAAIELDAPVERAQHVLTSGTENLS